MNNDAQAPSVAVWQVQVWVHTPAHSLLARPLTYLSDRTLAPGTLVRVPLGSREVLGVVWEPADAVSAPDPGRLRPVAEVLDALAPLNAHWRTLIDFAGNYYQRSPGEVALTALPPQLRDLSGQQLARRLHRRAPAQRPARGQTPQAAATGLAEASARPAWVAAPEAADPGPQDSNGSDPVAQEEPDSIALSAEQTRSITLFHEQSGPFLLFGATGSGKTEVFLRCASDVLAADPRAQVLVLVPEINLTPQLEARFRDRFAAPYGPEALVSLHSGLTPAQRLANWLAAHGGAARIVLGTRMAIFASLPHLRLIVVDEEHDPSYKSQEGARYSARDLAVFRGKREGAKVLLGSATPSLESWRHSRPGGRYQRLDMPSRVGQAGGPADAAAGLPRVRTVDMRQQARSCVIAPPLLQAMAGRIALGEQVMVFLNRRGYAPVLSCNDCDWKSACPHCSAYRVFHKVDRSLRCHHCGHAERVPHACPDCGSLDIAPVGRGTERLEEQLGLLLADLRRANGQPLRIARIDADTTRVKGALESQLARVHAGEVDVLVGTQMIAKGHDFRRIGLVAALQPDNALFSSDFRAPERLFCLLMQAAGRAGRDASQAGRGEMWVQTFHPDHPLYQALRRHDYPAFADAQLQDRQSAGMPPFCFQALIRAEARTQDAAQAFLNAARQAGASAPQLDAWRARVTMYPAVPTGIQRVANVERAQMLLESDSRSALQAFLSAWQPLLHGLRSQPQCKGLQRWAIDVDPLQI